MEVTLQIHLWVIISEMLVNIDPDNYSDKVVIEGGKKVIYEVLLKELYGKLVSILLLCR